MARRGRGRMALLLFEKGRDTVAMDLTGKLLIAMPSMGDPRFARAVVFMCAHSPEGAMGLIVNRRAEDISFADLLDQLSIPRDADGPMPRVHLGGPVESGRGFVLHSGDFQSSGSTLAVDDTFAMTATLDILESIAQGRGPARSLLALGYAGWGPGQIESELQQNAWLVGDADPALVFGDDIAGKWSAALAVLGIDPVVLSGAGGRA